MADKTEILLVSSGQNGQDKLITALSQAELNVQTCQFKTLAQTLSQKSNFDILVFNIATLTTQDQLSTCLTLAEKIKHNCATKNIRLLCIGIDQTLMQDQQNHDFDDLIFGDIRIPSVVARVKAQIRLNTMQSELNRRLHIAERYQCEALINNQLNQPIKEASILVTGRPNGYSVIEETLSANCTLIGTLSLETAKDYLNRQPFDMVIINGGRMPTRFLPFVEQIKKNPQLFTLPILLVAYPSKLTDSHIAYEAGITDIIGAPVNRNELLLRTTSLIREWRFRSAMAQSYLSARHIPTNDALTGLYTYSFYREHLDQIIKDHSQTKRTFTLITIAIENMSDINTQYGYMAGDQVLSQISEILMTMIRGEDLAARISGNKFVLTLPDTSADHASKVLKRIESILKQTEFMGTTGGAPITVDLAAHVLESNGDLGSDELVNLQTVPLKQALSLQDNKRTA